MNVNCRLVTASIIALIPFASAIVGFIDGTWFSGFALLCTAVLFFVVINAGIIDNIESDFTKGMVAIICLLSVAQVVSTSKFLDFDSVKKDREIFSKAINIRYCPQENQPDEKLRQAFSKLHNSLIMQCATQHIQNAQNFIFDIQKARLLDPATGAVDTIYSQLVDKEKITCMNVAKQLNEICPNILDI
ncbi:hypothetical protein [Vibrio vulnificus]|uniref:hypothetical protein n=1 Tax=Vibrio vulnificus TaxID=672 RepID=UPI0005010CA6|nr:hypothetical protein [Vibrio vulnificus]ASJ38442.1 hypothetical protein VVCECT4999_06975 [Vibrio vulnificus]EGR0642129.1 hypothetical protein [Vibrio vulnificus]EGR0651349.1 hypothetical protein [Vibrio vulnificus]EID4444530.1 hypothetical protein [Vibrio vulnificus]KGK68484.1 hypothetical protein NA76_20920 [Vibrio vulnificus]